MQSVNRKRKLLVSFLFLGFLIVQLAFLRLLPASEDHSGNSDYLEFYGPVAQNILDGRGLVEQSGELATRYPPGFPLVLTAEYYMATRFSLDKLQTIVSLNIVITGITCFLVFILTERVFSTRTAVIASALWVTYPFNLWLVRWPNSEVPFIPLIVAGVLLFDSGARERSPAVGFTVGIALGLAALIRPIGILLGVLFAAAALFAPGSQGKKRRVAHSFLILVGFCLAVLPWELFVVSRTDKVIPLSTNGMWSVLDGLTFVKHGDNDVRVPYAVGQLMSRIVDNEPRFHSTSDVFTYMLEELKHDPKPVAELATLKCVRSWFGTYSSRHERAIRVIQTGYLSLSVLGLLLALRNPAGKRFFVTFVGIIIVYFWFMTTIALSILRYMVPAMPFVLMFCAAALDAAAAKSWERGTEEPSTAQLISTG